MEDSLGYRATSNADKPLSRWINVQPMGRSLGGLTPGVVVNHGVYQCCQLQSEDPVHQTVHNKLTKVKPDISPATGKHSISGDLGVKNWHSKLQNGSQLSTVRAQGACSFVFRFFRVHVVNLLQDYITVGDKLIAVYARSGERIAVFPAVESAKRVAFASHLNLYVGWTPGSRKLVVRIHSILSVFSEVNSTCGPVFQF